jgi:hypothetical protein
MDFPGRPVEEESLDRWETAGLLTAAQAAAIREFESARRPPEGQVRPGIMEALVYLGLAVIGVGVVVLASTNWEHLQSWARIITPLVPGLLAIAAGPALRASGQPGMRRGAGMAWFLGLALVTGSVAVFGSEADWSGRVIVMAAGSVASGLALALWAAQPWNPQVFGIGAAFFLLSMSISASNDADYVVTVQGGAWILLGAAGIALAEPGLFYPRLTAKALSGLVIAGGSLMASVEPGPAWGQAFAFLAGASLITLSIRRSELLYMVFGVAAVFIGLVAVITRNVDDPTVAALMLIAVGAALLGGVLVLARLRPWAARGVAS